MSSGRLTKAKINKRIIYQIIGFYTAREISNKLKGKLLNGIIYLQIICLVRVPRISIYKLMCCCCLVTVISNSFATLWTIACQPLCPWDFPGKNTGVHSYFLLQSIFATQGLNLCILLGRQIL